ncbi:SPASM domain-containing protein [Oleispirillum naphthae]|uniref:SPASM domain-containing protein n=1 Tax=Oleispirillum naphthae TaxID=2838853 RepID=UPI00308269BA
MHDLAGRFCAEPFEHFEILLDGRVSPCCSLWVDLRLGNVHAADLSAIWNGALAQEMRRSILDGSFRHCRKDRCAMIVNGALPHRGEVSEPHLRAAIDNGATVMEKGPRHLFLAHDATCNLACPSCRSGLIAASGAQKQRLNRVAERVVLPAVASGDLRKLSVAGQGDPWASPHYRSILSALAEDGCPPLHLALYTNAVLMSEKTWQAYEGLERHEITVCVSVDAASAFTYARLRPPGRWEQLLRNLAFIGEMRARGAVRLFELNMTVQADNYVEMAEFARLARSVGCDHALFYLIRNTGSHLGPHYADCDLSTPAHPEHAALLEVLRDPLFADPFCRLFDIQTLREEACGPDAPPPDAFAELVRRRMRSGAAEDWSAEGMALLEINRPWRAAQRFLRAVDRDPSARNRLDLGVALFLAGLPAEAMPHLESGQGDDSLSAEERAALDTCLAAARAESAA